MTERGADTPADTRTRPGGPPPDAFAIVMATGILAVAAVAQGFQVLAVVLLGLAAVAFVGLAGRLALQGRVRRLVELSRTPDLVLRAFTFVAAAAVLATAVAQVGGPVPVVGLLAAVALAGWLVLFPPAVRDALTVRPAELRAGVHGAWLLVSVGTSGLAAVAAILAARLSAPALLVAAAALWVLAVVLYVLVTALIIRRLARGPLAPDDVGPDSLVLLGALALSTLTGDQVQAALARLGGPPAAVAAAHGLTLGVAVAAVAWALPLLGAQVWVARRVPGYLTYRGGWWAAVFPFGTSSAAAAATAPTWPLPALTVVSLAAFWIALALWAVVAVGLVHQAVRALRG